MKKISFYPGPSRVESKIPGYFAEAYSSGILSMNHRSQPFMDLLKENDRILKNKLDIPETYSIYYTSSATECWEIITQSISREIGSYHSIGGAFGRKWYHYASSISDKHKFMEFDPGKSFPLPEFQPENEAVICLTQNETSNGSQIPGSVLSGIRSSHPENIIAIDPTSSMAGIYLDFESADIWFASVQKCFGIPSGLALLICSPRAVERFQGIKENDHYNSLVLIDENMKSWQTPYTPNILGIYLLNRVMSDRNKIKKVDHKIRKRVKQWHEFFEASKTLDFYIMDPELRSQTVLALKGDPKHIKKLKKKAIESGIILGNGYGDLKEDTFRIANFPAIKRKEIRYLRNFLSPLI